MLKLAIIPFLLFFHAPQQSKYDDQIWKRGSEEPIKCKITKETCIQVEYFIKAGESIQDQKLDIDLVERIQYDPAKESANYNRGMTMMEAQKFKDAIPCFDRAIKDWARDPSQQQYAFYQKALCHEYLGEMKEAGTVYDDLIKIHEQTRFLKDVFRNRFKVAFRAKDTNAAKSILDNFEKAADRVGKRRAWQGGIDLLKAELYESQGDWAKAKGVYEKYENDTNPDVAEDAILGVLKALRAMRNSGDLYQKCASLVSSAKSPRVLAAAYNGVGDKYLQESKPFDAMLSFLRGVVQYRVAQTEEHEYALYGAAVATARYAGTLPASNDTEKGKKELYKTRAARNLSELKSRYPKSAFIADAQKEFDKIK